MSTAVEFTRFYLAFFYTGFAAFYTARIIFMKHATEREVVFPGARFCKTWWNHMTFRFFRVAIWMVCVLRAVMPEIDPYLGVITSMQRAEVVLPGACLLTIGAIMTVWIHCTLGKEWRSGIDPSGPRQIITNGLYSYTRNPMFVFVAIAQLGFFLALPSVFSLLCLVIGLYTLNSQALAEERHLSSIFPNEYLQYSGRVRRWL